MCFFFLFPLFFSLSWPICCLTPLAGSDRPSGAPSGGRGFGRGRGDGGGRGEGGGRGRGRGGPKRGGPKKEDDITQWVPVTKLGRLVKARLIKSLEAVYLFSLPVKEHQIIETFLPEIKDEVMKIMPIQKQTRAGQRTRFKAFVIVGDMNGHIGLGVKCAKEVANAIRGAIITAKLAVIPVRRGYWGNRIGAVHTVPTKITAKCGSISVRLIPAPRGTGLVAARAPKKLLQYAGVNDCFTSATGKTATMGNFIKATFGALKATYSYLTPDLWKRTAPPKAPFSEFSNFFEQQKKKVTN